jgi:hypothetical protein
VNVGCLYGIRDLWNLPRNSLHDWKNAGVVLYLGEDICKRDDATNVVNHAVLVDGKRVLLDSSFLRFLEPLSESR